MIAYDLDILTHSQFNLSYNDNKVNLKDILINLYDPLKSSHSQFSLFSLVATRARA
jgi:hypothetical protein